MVNENHPVNSEESKPLGQERDRNEDSEFVPISYGEIEDTKDGRYPSPPERGIPKSGNVSGTAIKVA